MSKSNELTRAIIKYLIMQGHQAERISPEGRMVKVRTRSIDYISGGTFSRDHYKRIPSSMTKGTADISATIFGRSVKIEVKIGKDRQSESQKRYQQQVEKAGGTYVIALNMDQFLVWYWEFKNRHNG